MKIENDNELAQAKRDLEAFERHSTALSTACQIRFAIAEYERNSESARVSEIAAGLSDKAKARLIFLGTGENSSEAVTGACEELRGKQIEEFGSVATPLGLAVLAESQNVKPPLPERWGVFRDDTGEMLCKCCEKPDAVTVANALCDYLNEFYSVRKI